MVELESLVTTVVDEGLGNCVLPGRPRRRRRAGRRPAPRPARRAGRRRRRPACGSRSPPTPTCTPTSSPAPANSPTTTAPRCWPPQPATASFEPRGLARRRRGRPGRAGPDARGPPRPHRRAPVATCSATASGPLGVFTGGSLIVGSAARTDLLGARRDRGAGPGPVPVAAAALAAARRRPRCADPRRGLVLLGPARRRPHHHHRPRNGRPTRCSRTADEDAFVAALLGALGSYPPYFVRLGEINRRGPALLDSAAPAADSAVGVAGAHAAATAAPPCVDVRPVADYAAGHIPGSVSIPLRAQFATWLGWLVAPDTPVVVRPRPRPGPRRDRLAGR